MLFPGPIIRSAVLFAVFVCLSLTGILILPDASASVTKSVYEQYLLAYDNEKFQQALNLINSCLAKNPEDCDYLVARARVYTELKMHRNAIIDCTKAIKKNPRFIPAYRARAYCFLIERDYAKGIADLEKCIGAGAGAGLELDNVFPLKDYVNLSKAYAIVRNSKKARQNAVYASYCQTLTEALDLREASQLKASLNRVESVIKKAPAFLISYPIRGVLRLNLQNNKGAVSDFSTYLKHYPDETPLLYLRADAYRELEDYPAAIIDLSHIIKLKARVAALRFTANTGRFREHFKYSDVLPVNLADIYFLRASCYLGARDLKHAEADFNQVIKLDPKEWEAFYQRGKIRIKQNQAQMAVADFNRVLALRPKFHEALLERARAYEKLGQKDKAEADLSAIVGKNPDDPGALTLRAHFFERIGNLDKALLDYSKVIALAPKDDDGYRYRAEIYMKKKDYKKAIADLNKALQLGSEDRAAIEKVLQRAKRLLK